jgi:hypothetical protein
MSNTSTCTVAIELKQSPVAKQSKKRSSKAGVNAINSILGLTFVLSRSRLPGQNDLFIVSFALGSKKTMILQMICDVSDFIVLYVQKISCPRTFYEICTTKFCNFLILRDKGVIPHGNK